MAKRILYINRKPPHGTIHAQEALDVVLIGAAFGQEISLAFIDDGVYQLLPDQDTRSIGRKNFAAALRTLGDHDIRRIYVDAHALQQRGLHGDDLIEINWFDEDGGGVEKSALQLVEQKALQDIIDRQDVVFSF